MGERFERHRPRLLAPEFSNGYTNRPRRKWLKLSRMTENTLPLLDVSMVVNIHAGGSYLRRTMRSLEAAARKARSSDLKIELLLALDRSPPETLAWVEAYHSDAFERTRVIRLDNGSLGLSRQDGLRHARANYIQFCDEDDLISSNTTLVSHQTALKHSPRTIVVPEYLFGFGSLHLLAIYNGSASIPPIAFFSQHPYISRLFVHRSIVDLNHFIDVRLGPGYAYEDWHFNATAIAKGAEFVVAPAVILFYRHRANSLSSNMNSQSARLIPPTPLFEPQTYLALAAPGARRFLRYGQDAVDCETERLRFLMSLSNCEEVRLANLIDPAISLGSMEHCPVVSTRNGDFAAGVGYFEACRRVAGLRFTEVGIVSTPTSPQGKAVFSALKALSDIDSATQSLILIDDPAFDEDMPSMALGNTVIVNLAHLVEGLSADQRDLVAYRLIEIASTSARLHLASDTMSARILGRYGRLLADRDKIFYRADDRAVRFRGVSMVQPDPFDFLSEFLDDATLVIHSSETGQRDDRARLDRRADIWRIAYSPVEFDAQRTARQSLSHRILAIGLTAPEAAELQQLCAAAGLKIRLVTATETPAEKELANFDLALVMNGSAATYDEFLALLRAGLPLVGAELAPLSEVMGRGAVFLTISTSDSTRLAEARDCFAAFYRDASLRERLTLGIRTFLETHHSPASHRSCIAELLKTPAASVSSHSFN